MRKSLTALGIMLPALALAAACGQSTSVFPGNAPAQPTQAACPNKPLSISEQDNGKTFCVGQGSEISVLLHGTPQQMWARPEADGNQNMLMSKQNGKLMLPLGGSGAAFGADHPGTVHIHSSKKNCPGAEPGQMMCNSIQSFQVTINIT